MPRRKRSSWGCVQRLGPDTYRIRYVRDGRRVSETVRGTRRQADDRLAALRVEVGSGHGTTVTVGQAFERWYWPDVQARLEAGELAPTYVANLASVWRCHVRPRWGDVNVLSVRPMDVEAWFAGITSAQAKLARVVANGVMDKCVKLEIAERNPFALGYRTARSSERDKRIYSLEELRGAYSAMAGTHVEGAVILMAFGGCRVGESLGVAAREVELLDGGGVPVAVAPIVRQVENRGREVVERLKNPQSRRHVFVPGKLGERLAEIASGRGDAWLSDDGTGRPATQQTLGAVWRRSLMAAGIEPIPVRNLRNSWQTYMHWDLHVGREAIERMMGHVGKTVTERHYDRPDVERLASTVAKAYAESPFADCWDILGHL